MLQRKLNMSYDKVVRTVDRHANTSAASIPLAFDEAMRKNMISAGILSLLKNWRQSYMKRRNYSRGQTVNK